jgi:cbb3-type cytochrome oxidase cytochrome c subunit
MFFLVSVLAKDIKDSPYRQFSLQISCVFMYSQQELWGSQRVSSTLARICIRNEVQMGE